MSMLGDSTIYTILPLHIEAAGITLAAVGILMGINRFVRIFSNTISGYLFDFGRKRQIFILSLLAGSLSTLSYAAFTGFWPLFAARILWGVAWSGISIGGTSILLAETNPENRGKWIGLYHVWTLAGSAFGSFLGGFLSDIIGYRGAMAVNGTISLASVIAVYIFMPALNETVYPRPSFSDIKKDYKIKFNSKIYLAAGVLGISRFVFSGFVAALLSVITRDKISPGLALIGISTLTGIISSSKTVISMISAPAAGFLSDRFKDRWSAVVICLLCGSLGLFMITLKMPVLIFAGLLLGSVPGSSINVLMRTIAGDMAGTNRQGRAIGFVLTAGDLASAAGPPLAFFLLPYMGIDLMFLVLSMMLAASAGFVYLIEKNDKKAGSGI